MGKFRFIRVQLCLFARVTGGDLRLNGATLLNGAQTTSEVTDGIDGLLYGGTGFFVKQLVAVVGSSIYAFAFTWGMLWLINRFTPVRTTEEEEQALDAALHGETAYE